MEEFFADLLPIEYPFCIERVEKEYEELAGQAKRVKSVRIRVGLSSDWQVEAGWKVHSWHERQWRHLSLFEYPCYIVCRLPVLQEKSSKITKQLAVSWARPYSGFTLFFEEVVLDWIRQVGNIATVARLLGEYPQRIRAIYDHYTRSAYQQRNVRAPERLGIDETSTRKGHEYITLFVDMQQGQLLDIQDGRDSPAIEAFTAKVDSQTIKAVSMDMSPAFISGVTKHLPQAAITFDRFHVVRHIGKEVEAFPPSEARYVVKEQLNQLYQAQTKEEMAAYLAYWCDLLEEKLNATKLAKSLRRHFEGIVNYAQSKLTNALLEGINSKVQIIKRLARGFRYTENFKRMILFVFGTIQSAPSQSTKFI
jgi:transposase